MIVSLLMVFILFAAMVVNVGQAVNRRIALQIVADAGAWTGATNQAIGLNKLAELNLYLQEFWALLTQAEAGFSMPSCEVAIPALAAYEAATPQITMAFEAINMGYPTVAYNEAFRVTNYNLEDLFPGEIKTRFTQIGPGMVPGAPLVAHAPVIEGTVPNTVGALSPARWFVNWQCVEPITKALIPMYAVFVPSLWQMRVDPGRTDFWWYVKAPATRALLFDELFGPNAIPEMEAVGAAKPVGGNILWGQQQYVTKLIPVASAVTGDAEWTLTGYTTSASVQDAYRGLLRLVTH